jgi:hypothetical protein
VSDSNVKSVPQDPYQGVAQSGAINGINGLGSAIGANQNAYYTAANNAATYGQSAIQGAGQAGAAGVGVGQNAVNNSNILSAIPQSVLPFIQSTLNQGFDPQSALYNQQHQQNTDATNAGLAARGLTTSPWAAGVAADSDQKFNTNWQATLLDRENTAANTASTLAGTAGGAATTAANVGAAGANDIATGTSLPYTTAQGIDKDLASFLPFLTSVQQQQIADYLGYGQNATAQDNASTNAGRAQDQADQAFGQGLGSLLSSLFGKGGIGTNVFGGAGGGEADYG